MIHVDAQNLAVQIIEILCAIVGVAVRAAVAHGNIKKSVRAELDHAGLMHGRRLRDGEQHLLCGVGNVRIRRRDLIFGNHRLAVRLANVVNEEAVIRRKFRMKGEAQKSLLAA